MFPFEHQLLSVRSARCKPPKQGSYLPCGMELRLGAAKYVPPEMSSRIISLGPLHYKYSHGVNSVLKFSRSLEINSFTTSLLQIFEPILPLHSHPLYLTMASAPEAVPPRWDPIQVLSINQKRDGNFTCAGVKAGDVACGWNIRGPTAASIQNLIDTLSVQPPRSAIPSLRILAEAAICQHHKQQISIKVQSWTVAINTLPASRSVQHPAPPSLSQQSSTSTSTPPLPRYEIKTPTSSASYSEDATPRPYKRDTVDPWQKIEDLEDKIEKLTRRLEAIEVASPSIFSKLRKSK
jgi:hypothetical protein